MSLFDDYEPNPFDDDDAPRGTTCHFCGKEGLTWEHDGDKWVLLEANSRIHKCSDKALVNAALDDFEDLT